VRQGAPRRRSVDGCLAAETAPGSLERLKQAETPWVCSGKSSSQTDRTICSIGSGTRPYADLPRLVTGHASPDKRNDEPLAHTSSSALLGHSHEHGDRGHPPQARRPRPGFGGRMTRCPVCGASLEGRHPSTRTCSPSCRREAARYRAVLSGRRDGAYFTVLGLAQRRSRVRANRSNRKVKAA